VIRRSKEIHDRMKLIRDGWITKQCYAELSQIKRSIIGGKDPCFECELDRSKCGGRNVRGVIERRGCCG
jgi:hypothetical protein